MTKIVSRVFFILKRCDILIVHREAFPFFTPLLERLAVRRSTLAVLDIDDAIHAHPTHIKDWRSLLRDPSKALKFPDIFDLILCGNEALVETYGTSTALSEYQPTCPPVSTFDVSRDEPATISLLWTGSQSTLGSLKSVLPEVLEACDQEDIYLDVLGGANVNDLQAHPRLRVHRWSKDREAKLLGEASIGLMPLPDTEWERGKSGYKAILYLCAGMRAIVSPVGMNARLCTEYDAISPCDSGKWGSEIRRVVQDIKGNRIDLSSRDKARLHFDADQNARHAAAIILRMLQERAPMLSNALK
ncbi:hypothetical protein GCM10009589_16820 [Arthrobacter pascens]